MKLKVEEMKAKRKGCRPNESVLYQKVLIQKKQQVKNEDSERDNKDLTSVKEVEKVEGETDEVK